MNVKEYWETESTQSMSDFRISNLESLLIAKHIRPEDRLLNVGCGDGTGCHLYRNIPSVYVGLDRSTMMLERFQESAPGFQLIQGDMKDLPEMHMGAFDVIVTQRSLINLETPEEQRSVLKQLGRMTESRLVICEAFQEGLDRLNELHRATGQPEHKMRWHNLYLTNDVVKVLESDFELQHEEDLSAYFLMTRVLQPLLTDSVTTDSVFNEMAEKIQPLVPELKGVGYIKLQNWTKTRN